MAVELPRDLRDANLREIEILYPEPELAWRALAVNQVTVPVNVLTVVEILVTKQVKAMAADLLCLENDVLGPRGERLFEQSAQRCHIRGGEEKMSGWFWLCDGCILESTTISIKQHVCASGHVLPEAVQ